MKILKNKMNHIALLNPYHSVSRVITEVKESETRYLVGVKDVEQIPVSIIEKLEKTGKYLHHTLDCHALGGRALDLFMINPITGRWMTGSSSGTAINVRCGINDLGIGTDGGGSVLAPALAVQCFGLICPLIEAQTLQQYRKKSTDNIEFYPSIGLISRDWDVLVEAFSDIVGEIEEQSTNQIFIANTDKTVYPFSTQTIEFVDTLADRNTCIEFLQQQLSMCDVLIEQEGPIDLEGFGDSVFGHFDPQTHSIQRQAKKGLIRVANMVNATCLVIPTKQLACGIAILCESKLDKIGKAIAIARQLAVKQDELVERYFLNYEMYCSKGYGG